MKTCIELGGGVPQETITALKDEVESNWNGTVTVISNVEGMPAGTEALLIVGSGNRDREYQKLVLLERIAQFPNELGALIFLVNAKLGRLTRSDLAKTKGSLLSGEKEARLSRRGLFSAFRGGLQAFSELPVVFSEACDAKYGCTRCIRACPFNAISLVSGQVQISEEFCTKCGLCIPSCPTSAIHLPRFSEDSFSGILEGMVKSTAPKRTLVLTCNKDRVATVPWMDVEQVSDVGLVGVRTLNQAASSGISALAVYCVDGKCAGKQKVKDTVALFNSTLKEEIQFKLSYFEGISDSAMLKEFHEKLPFKDEVFLPPLKQQSNEPWRDYALSLKKNHRAESPATDYGLTEVLVSDNCTLCSACEKYCPHGALASVEGKLEFDATSCTGCGYCGSICPEHAITTRPLTKIGDLSPRSAYEDRIVKCERCGSPIDSEKLLKRVATVVGDGSMLKYCNNCKQQIAFQKLYLNKR